MLQHLEQFDYLEKYKGKTLLVKISGAEIASEDFQKTVEDIQTLIHNGVKIIFVFGGGNQIDKFWEEKHKEPRPKGIDGVNITSQEVFDDAVFPAYIDLSHQLSEQFSEIPWHFISPNQLQTVKKDGAGLVGTPTMIDGIDINAPLNVVGFVGEAGNEQVNVNADDVCLQIAKQCHSQIAEVMFITSSKGILNTNGNLVPFLSQTSLAEVIAGTHKKITVDGGMKKKVESVESMLPFVPKVVMIDNQGLAEEIENFEGSGTLICDINQGNFGSLQYRNIFDAVYEANSVKNGGNWKERSSEQLDALFQNHTVLTVNESHLGGFSLTPQSLEIDGEKVSGLLLECFWSAKKGNGVGEKILTFAKEQAQKQGFPLFAFSKDAIFERNGFESKNVFSASGAQLRMFVDIAL